MGRYFSPQSRISAPPLFLFSFLFYSSSPFLLTSSFLLRSSAERPTETAIERVREIEWERDAREWEIRDWEGDPWDFRGNPSNPPDPGVKPVTRVCNPTNSGEPVWPDPSVVKSGAIYGGSSGFPAKTRNPEPLRPVTHDPLNRVEDPILQERFSGGPVAISGGFSRKIL